MLHSLRDWWQSGFNDHGTLQPDSISPIPAGMSLLEAERLVRLEEPGDGGPQLVVLEHLDKIC